VDRKKDLIISAGYNIYPREIDEVLHQHPKIQEAVAVGVPCDARGEVVKAFSDQVVSTTLAASGAAMCLELLLETSYAGVLHVCDAAVLDRVAVVTAAGRTGVTVEPIAGTAAEVARQVTAAGPHVLHLLCHGGQVAGLQTLALATMADFDADEQTGSVRLTVADLVAALRGDAPWLVVLAACESAEAAEGSALAHDIVDSGVPAVIGMRRLVDLNATNRFCAVLYPEVLATVRAAVDPGGPPGARVIDWVGCLTGPRTALGGVDPVTVDAWSDPVLYVQADPLRVLPPSPHLSADEYAELRAQLDLWESYLRSQDPTTASPAVLAEVGAKVQRLTALLDEAVR
jgi:hypothetical protein